MGEQRKKSPKWQTIEQSGHTGPTSQPFIKVYLEWNGVRLDQDDPGVAEGHRGNLQLPHHPPETKTFCERSVRNEKEMPD